MNIKQSNSLFIVLILYVCLFVYPQINAQKIDQDTLYVPSALSYGLFSGIGPGIHSGGFGKFQGIPSCCPKFDAGYGLGSSSGLMLTYTIGDKYYITARGSFNGMGANFVNDEIQYVNDNGNIKQAIVKHTLATSLSSISAQANYGIKIGQISFDAGYWIGMPISANFYQKETVFPGTFLNGSRIRNEYRGDIPETPVIVNGIQGGIHYSLPLNSERSLFIVPECTILQTFGSLSGTTGWQTLQIRAGIALLWNNITMILPPPPPPPVPPPIIIPPKPVPPLAISLTVSGYIDSEIKPLTIVKVEEIVHYETQPLLPYIFFDEMSATIPERYKLLSSSEIPLFTAQDLVTLTTIERYYHTLNIAGKTLKDNPLLTIELRGCASGFGNEKNNRALGRLRSETIALYLHDMWHVSSTRINITSREIPENPSNNQYAEGQAENRRVELIMSDPTQFESIQMSDTIRVISPSRIVIAPKIISGPAIRQWRTSVFTESGLPQFESNGSSLLESSFEWKPEFSSLPRANDSIFIEFNVVDTISRSMSAYWHIPYQYISARISRNTKQKGTKQLKTYSLILFDFDKAYLDPRNARLLSNIIKEIPENASITILGATDSYGNEDRNKALAQERANTVGTVIGVKTVTIQGVPGYTKYPNDVPEGRFYNRTVEITVETGGD